MGRKIFLVAVVVGAVIIAYLFWFAVGLDFHQDAAQIAVNGSEYTGNFSGLEDAIESSPFWLSFLPAFVGIIMIILILRLPEKQ